MSYELYRKRQLRIKKLEELHILIQKMSMAISRKDSDDVADVWSEIAKKSDEIDRLPPFDASMRDN